MSILFFDSSALAKRYMPEVGTIWVRSQTARSSGNNIAIAQITPVELYSAISRQYHDKNINLSHLQGFRQLFMRHVQNQYLVLALSQAIVMRALSLHEIYRLRAYDSVQLASALELHTRLSMTGGTFVFVSSDIRLLQAATSEGILADDPNNYP